MSATLLFGHFLPSNQIPVGGSKDEQLTFHLWALQFLQRETESVCSNSVPLITTSCQSYDLSSGLHSSASGNSLDFFNPETTELLRWFFYLSKGR